MPNEPKELPRQEITLDELYQVVGELEIVRRKFSQQLQQLYTQVDEMAKEIANLRNKDGGLAKADNH
jgi:uncharacterized coiled-coil protein SlyX